MTNLLYALIAATFAFWGTVLYSRAWKDEVYASVNHIAGHQASQSWLLSGYILAASSVIVSAFPDIWLAVAWTILFGVIFVHCARIFKDEERHLKNVAGMV